MNDRIQQLIEMLKNEPEDSFLNYALALEYAKIDQKEEALKLMEAVSLKDENYLGVYYQYGKLNEEVGQHEKAIAIYRKGIEIATKLGNKKAIGELNEALWMLED